MPIKNKVKKFSYNLFLIASVIVLTIILSHFNLKAFKTLSNAQKYSAELPEVIGLENNNINDPIYTKWHKNLVQNKSDYWSPILFKNQLISVLKQRQISGLYGNYINKFSPPPEAKFIVFGSLHGSFNSLVRALTFLEKKKYINNNLKIIKPDTFIIFNGDVVDGSPFILETFSLILRLMQQNFKHVIYLKGKNETDQYWKNDGLKRELKIRFPNLVNQKIPLENLVNSFFETLPLAFYITGLNPKEGLIRVSFFDLNYSKINENYCADILNSLQYNVLQKCNLNNTNNRIKAPQVKAIIKNKEKLTSYNSNFNGLTLLDTDQGATSWKIFSAPSFIYQNYFNFYSDAFIVVKTGAYLNQSTISLYNRDVREQIGFKNSKTYNLIFTKKLKNTDILHKKLINTKNISQEEITKLENALKKTQQRVEKLSQDFLNFKNQVNNLLFESKTLSIAKS